ncbi:hypothetical protein PV05_12042 [Exophiala xenobiotica]|uniref:ZZ-type domain-containing protein n=1 Tax=Exophiala xenobiotica TaxID=348802 RepID=A0A0D2E6U1_9EURO|nr:uncharacterized protein PV05_12042 [Exophiala xenobiotica]KIW50455.1 hypothetical protein PV05_12042 [Exophiala xenobiotica]
MASQTDESKDESLPEIECDHCSRRFKANDRFYICAQCYNFDLCQACVLKADTLPEEHDLRCGLVDARDLRRTFVSGPSPSEFKTLIDNAKSDPNFKLPASAQNFLSRGATHGIEGSVVERLAALESYQAPSPKEPATSRSVSNDYSMYQELDRQKKDIRLILLLKGPASAPVTALVGRFAHPWAQVPWTALSYCWGSLDEVREVYLYQLRNRLHDGQTPDYNQQRFSCTASLEIALRGVRREDVDLWLWVDALCINQGHRQERAYQVSIMSEIFEKASRVVIWLGFTQEEMISASYIRALAQASNNVPENANIDRSSRIAGDIPLIKKMLFDGAFSANGKTLDRSHVLQKISEFFDKPWFRRVWVLQEVWCAGKDVVALCGPRMSVPWSEILFADMYLTVAFSLFKTRIGGLKAPWRNFEKRAESQDASTQRLPILELFEAVCHNFEASDQRDKLFGLLTMGKETHDICNLPDLIRPDYGKSTAQVFMDFTRWCIHQDQSLAVLGYSTFMRQPSISSTEADALPSWSLSDNPAFAGVGTKLSTIPEFRACANTRVDMELMNNNPDPRLLPLRGYRLDTVSHANELFFHIRFDQDNDLYLMNNTNTWYTGAGGGLHWLWRSARGRNGKEARDCEPVEGSDLCTCQEVLNHILLVMTCGGMQEHGDCDHSKGTHRTRWLEPTDLYPMFAAHYVKHGDEKGDFKMEYFCKHVREILLPLVDTGNADKLSELMLKASRRSLFTTKKRVGLCPPGTKVDDVVVALFGGKAPFVLRPRGVDDGADSQTWEFIGECFLLDVMRGDFVERLLDRKQASEVFHLR